MQKKYLFYYDESEHSRSITKATINAENFANDFVVCVIGHESGQLEELCKKYQIIEEKYKKYYSVNELKSRIISKTKYRFGLKEFKNEDINFINDVLSFIYDENILVFLSLQNKIEYIINQLLVNYENDLIVDADSLRYSISKLITIYKPKDVIESIYLNNGTFLLKLRKFLNSLLKLNKNNPIKVSENTAISQGLLVLDSYNGTFNIKWNYRMPFIGFKNFLKERSIANYSLYLDKEGTGNTYSAACEENLSNVVEIDSIYCFGIRISDILAGIISRFISSISDALSYKNVYDGQKLKYLPIEWFDIDEQKFNLYKLIKKVIIDLNKSWFKTYCTNCSDDFVYFLALLHYFDHFSSFDEYKKDDLKLHPRKVNNYACYMLNERFSLMHHKLKIDPIQNSNFEFYYNQKGAKVYYDYTKHKELIISDHEIKYQVLSVGFFGKMEKACITINENGNPTCYLLPDELMDWAVDLVYFADRGISSFPKTLIFKNINGKIEISTEDKE